MHKKIREVASIYNNNTKNILVDSKIFIDENEILETWYK